MLYSCLGDAGGVVNTTIVLATATGIVQRKDPTSSQCNGGSIVLKKSWAKYLLKFVKCRATTKLITNCQNFNNLKKQFLLDDKTVEEMEEIPDGLKIIGIRINYVPVSEWTMTKEGSKHVKVVGLKGKTAVLVEA